MKAARPRVLRHESTWHCDGKQGGAASTVMVLSQATEAEAISLDLRDHIWPTASRCVPCNIEYGLIS